MMWDIIKHRSDLGGTEDVLYTNEFIRLMLELIVYHQV